MFLDNCIVELSTVDCARFDSFFDDISYWGHRFDRYTQRYVTENHVKSNPKLARHLGNPAQHYDFGVKEGTLMIPELYNVTRIISDAVSIGTVNFLWFPPNTKIGIHVDPPARETLLIIPITPLEDYSYPVFYEGRDPHTRASNRPHIVNTQIPHSLYNRSHHNRINFQLGLKHSFLDVKQMLNQGQFFV